VCAAAARVECGENARRELLERAADARPVKRCCERDGARRKPLWRAAGEARDDDDDDDDDELAGAESISLALLQLELKLSPAGLGG